MTLKEFFYYHDVHLIESWDHTAKICAHLEALTSVVINALSNRKFKPRSITDHNPYRKRERPGHKITLKNFQTLKLIGDALMRGK